MKDDSAYGIVILAALIVSFTLAMYVYSVT